MSETINIPAAILRAAIACTGGKKERVRPYLRGVLFTTEGDVVATNGHVLFHAANRDIKPSQDFILEFESAPIKSAVNCEIDVEAGRAAYAANAGTKYSEVTNLTNDWKYPQWQRVMPEDKKITALEYIGIQTQYLALPEKVFGNGPVKWEFFGNQNAMRVTAPKLEEFTDCTLVIMPVRLDV